MEAGFAGRPTHETEWGAFDARFARSYAAGRVSYPTAVDVSVSQDSPISPVVDAVNSLAAEQGQIRQSILELSVSVSSYAVHLKSHTSAVEALANVARMLEKSVKRQAFMERQECRAGREDKAERGPQEQEWTAGKRTFLKKGSLFDKTKGPQ